MGKGGNAPIVPSTSRKRWANLKRQGNLLRRDNRERPIY